MGLVGHRVNLLAGEGDADGDAPARSSREASARS